MGFGIMFLGVFFLWNAKVANIDVLPDFIGYLIILYGIKCAARYCNNFKAARLAAHAGCAVSIVVAGTQVFAQIGINPFVDGFTEIVGAVSQLTRIAFIMLLLLAIFKLAKETGASKTEKRSLISIISVPVLWLGYIAIGLLNYFGVIKDEKFLSAALLCEIVYVLLTAIAVFSAYMWICVEGDEDMPKRNKIKTPMDFFDRARERDAAEKAEKDTEAAKRQKAEAAGKTVAEMYGVKKKKKKGR